MLSNIMRENLGSGNDSTGNYEKNDEKFGYVFELLPVKYYL